MCMSACLDWDLGDYKDDWDLEVILFFFVPALNFSTCAMTRVIRFIIPKIPDGTIYAKWIKGMTRVIRFIIPKIPLIPKSQSRKKNYNLSNTSPTLAKNRSISSSVVSNAAISRTSLSASFHT